MRSVMSRVELLDREIIDADETHPERREVLGAIGSKVGVVAVEFALANELRVSRLQKHALVSVDWLRAQVCFRNRHDVVVEGDDHRWSDERVEGHLIDAD